jgi:hypothetical protein
MQARIHFTSSSQWSKEMACLGVAVLGSAVLGTAVLGVAVLGTAVLHPQIAHSTQPWRAEFKCKVAGWWVQADACTGAFKAALRICQGK